MSNNVRWTPEQQQAIEAGGCDLLVAAAAGSGKTAVLVERIIRKVIDEANPLDLDRLLVVTFTDAAAMEMRSRIGSALAKALEKQPTNRHLRKQAALLNKAQISTLHSFCLSVVRRYFFKLGLDPNFTVMGQNESILMKQEVLEQVLEEHYANGTETFFRLAEIFGSQGKESLSSQIARLAEFLEALPFPDRWIEEQLHNYEATGETSLKDQPWYRELVGLISLKARLAADYHRQALRLAAQPGGPTQYLETLQKELAAMELFLSQCSGEVAWDELRQRLQVEFKSLPRVKQEDADEVIKKRVQKLRDTAKDTIKEIREYFVRTEEELKQELLELGPMLRQLFELADQFQTAYSQAKGRKSQLDFNDLEHYCLQLLCDQDETGTIRPSQLAEELRQQYSEIMVDEYQDTNDMQEKIIAMLKGEADDGPSLFMVGDVKQSIYRFRMANPELFQRKYASYSKEEGSAKRKILLSANFRCRQEVVDGVNHIFRKTMEEKTAELNYDRDAELICRAGYPAPDEDTRLAAGPVELHVIEGNPDEEEENLTVLEREAGLIAYRIRQLLGLEGEPPARVWDKNANCYRPVQYKDIVVLLRSTRDKANTVLNILQQYGIPAYAELGTGYFQAVEINIMLSLLEIIDNPNQDIPLAAVLRSPLVGLTTNQLAAIRAEKTGGNYWAALNHYVKEKQGTPLAETLGRFIADLRKWRTRARQGPLSRLIWQIYQETGFLDYAAAQPGGQQRKANLHALYDRAREFDAFSRHGLFRFLRFIEKLREKDEDLGLAGAFGESDNVVRIMSIHKSKGLEFPVVFVANLGGKFNITDLSRDLLLHHGLGIASLYYDLKHRVKYPTAAYWAVRNALHRSALAEELRILYVAFTRAREKLILVGSTKKMGETREQWLGWKGEEEPLPLPVLATATRYLDWVGPAVLSNPGENLFSVEYWGRPDGKELPVLETGGKQDNLPWDKIQGLAPFAETETTIQGHLEQRLNWAYRFSEAAGIPAKLSVTELSKRMLERDHEAAPIRYSRTITSRPKFIQEARGLTGAELGTAMHMVMQHLDFKEAHSKEAIMGQIEKMVEQEFLTIEQAQAVGWKQFLGLFQSPLGKRLLEAEGGQVKREVPFTLSLPVREIYPDLTSLDRRERIIVQGIIDCLLIEEDGIVIIDYKNDQVEERDLLKKADEYRHQLKLYAKAVEKIFSLPVKEKYLYFFQLGKPILVSE
ncbi:MAG: helicase-exonuclease AddAB subunit AddA [Clostridia bacterium]|nr:helicase-exonuclease AddAB subunit AddA [Clostridia bacterium]